MRYLATAFIVNKKRRPQFKEFIKVIQQEQHSFADPITEFLACVYVNFDFEGAQKKMKECEDVRCLSFFMFYIYIYGVIFFRILRLLCLFLLIIKKWFLLNLGYCTVQVILNDPFLGKRVEESNYTVVPLKDEFLENARLFIFETYCRIHERINMGYKLIPLYYRNQLSF